MQSLYARILGADFEFLPPILRNIHDVPASKRYVGRCDIRAGDSWAAKLIARVAGLPRARSDVPLEVTISSTGRAESWTRMFGTDRMHSVLVDKDRLLQERLGPVVLTFELSAQADRIVWSLREARLALVPLPISWLLSCAATEALDNGRYGFDVSAHVRGIGLVIHYKGWLVEGEQ